MPRASSRYKSSSHPPIPQRPSPSPTLVPPNVAKLPPAHITTDSREGKRSRSRASLSPPPEDVDAPSGKRREIEPIPPAPKPPLPKINKTKEPPKMPDTTIKNGVRTLEDGLKITAAPPEGFPTPQLGESVWRNTSYENRLKWPQKKGAKAWVRVYRARYEENAQSTVAKLRNIVSKLVGVKNASDLVVSTPTAETELPERLPSPWHFLISGIPPDSIGYLLTLAVCSSTEVTCFFIPFEQPLPTYICTLENFTFPDSEKSNESIAEAVKSTLRSCPEIQSFIHARLVSPDAEAAITALDSIRATSLNIAISSNTVQTVWNIYCDHPPNFSLESYFEWSALIRRIRFHTEDYGTGTARLNEKQFICVGCKSFDHPTGLCPFPRIPGWFGPASSSTALEDLSMTSLDHRSPQRDGKKAGGSSRRGTMKSRGKRGRGRF